MSDVTSIVHAIEAHMSDRGIGITDSFYNRPRRTHSSNTENPASGGDQPDSLQSRPRMECNNPLLFFDALKSGNNLTLCIGIRIPSRGKHHAYRGAMQVRRPTQPPVCAYPTVRRGKKQLRKITCKKGENNLGSRDLQNGNCIQSLLVPQV